MADTTLPALAADAWFATRGWSPFPFQRQVWQAYLDGRSGLIHAATGTGKTQAAWWGPVLEWMGEVAETARAAGAPASLVGLIRAIYKQEVA